MNKRPLTRSNLFRQIIIYISFYLLVWLIQLILLSGSAFFHFLLGHRMEIIKEWIWDRGWSLITVSKLLSFYIMAQFIGIRDSGRRVLRNIWEIKTGAIKKEVLLSSAILLVLSIFTGWPATLSQTSIQNGQVVMGYLGNVLFYLIDIFLIVILQHYYPVGNSKRPYRLIFFCTVFFVFSKAIYFYATDLHYFIILNFLFCLYIVEYLPTNFRNVVALLLIFVAPMAAFFGIDPIWGNSFSVFALDKHFSVVTVLISYLLGFFYIYVKENSWEHVKKLTVTLIHQLTRYRRYNRPGPVEGRDGRR